MKALFPLDGSDAAYRALKRGLEFLKPYPQLRAVALHVRPPAMEGGLEPAPSAEDVLSRAKRLAADSGVDLETRSAVGPVIESIMEEARGFDLIVTHALGKTGLLDFFTGTGPEKLVRSAPTSVLVLRD